MSTIVGNFYVSIVETLCGLPPLVAVGRNLSQVGVQHFWNWTYSPHPRSYNILYTLHYNMWHTNSVLLITFPKRMDISTTAIKYRIRFLRHRRRLHHTQYYFLSAIPGDTRWATRVAVERKIHFAKPSTTPGVGHHSYCRWHMCNSPVIEK